MKLPIYYTLLLLITPLSVLLVKAEEVHASDLLINQPTYNRTISQNYGTCQFAQEIIPEKDINVTSVKVSLYGVGSVASQQIVIASTCSVGSNSFPIYTTYATSNSINNSIPNGTYREDEFVFNNVKLYKGIKYYFCISQGAIKQWAYGQVASGLPTYYLPGIIVKCGGTTNAPSRSDFNFKIYGNEIGGSTITTTTIQTITDTNNEFLIQAIALATMTAVIVSVFILL